MDTTLEVLPGEDEVQTITRKRVRVTCEECGEPAHYKHSWLLHDPRNNPASRAFRKDDCSWCEDDCSYACKDHTKTLRPPDGYEECSIFPASERFTHMFLKWIEVKAIKE